LSCISQLYLQTFPMQRTIYKMIGISYIKTHHITSVLLVCHMLLDHQFEDRLWNGEAST
jgi:hypothetical protein